MHAPGFPRSGTNSLSWIRRFDESCDTVYIGGSNFVQTGASVGGVKSFIRCDTKPGGAWVLTREQSPALAIEVAVVSVVVAPPLRLGVL